MRLLIQVYGGVMVPGTVFFAGLIPGIQQTKQILIDGDFENEFLGSVKWGGIGWLGWNWEE